MTAGDRHRFQVDLRGIVDILSHHLYGSPTVYVRELLQNAVDAVTARRRFGDVFAPSIVLEVSVSRGGGRTSLSVTDNGIGLTPGEVEEFLATIGRSSKVDELAQLRGDFLGQFGIGILACFVVSDEIVVVTQSSRPNEPAVEWRGRPDGTCANMKSWPTSSRAADVFILACRRQR